MDPMVYALRTGIFGGSGTLVFNRFTGPGRAGIPSMYVHLPTEEKSRQTALSFIVGNCVMASALHAEGYTPANGSPIPSTMKAWAIDGVLRA